MVNLIATKIGVTLKTDENIVLNINEGVHVEPSSEPTQP